MPESCSTDVRELSNGTVSQLMDRIGCVAQGYRVNLLEALASNSSMASTLATYSALTGDWCAIFFFCCNRSAGG